MEIHDRRFLGRREFRQVELKSRELCPLGPALLAPIVELQNPNTAPKGLGEGGKRNLSTEQSREGHYAGNNSCCSARFIPWPDQTAIRTASAIGSQLSAMDLESSALMLICTGTDRRSPNLL